MKEGWKYVTLPDISKNLDNLRKPVTKNKREAGLYPYYGASGIVDYVDSYIYDEDILLISEDGANLIARSTPIAFSVSGKVWVNNHAHVLSFPNLSQQRFVEYYFSFFDISDYITGAAQPKLSQKKLNSIPIPAPPLSEQQRIVTSLDTEFAEIDALKAKAAEEVANAKAMFDASLREEMTPKAGWEEYNLVKELKLKSGENLPAKKQEPGTIPVYGGNGITGFHNESNLSGSQILIGRVGALCGNIHFTNENIWVTDNAFIVTSTREDWDKHFLVYLLRFMNLNQYASQTAQPVISNKSMKDVVLSIPSFAQQRAIVSRLDSLRTLLSELEQKYAKIAAECDALKQAILKETFE